VCEGDDGGGRNKLCLEKREEVGCVVTYSTTSTDALQVLCYALQGMWGLGGLGGGESGL
jgi:hypothetical protein